MNSPRPALALQAFGDTTEFDEILQELLKNFPEA